MKIISILAITFLVSLPAPGTSLTSLEQGLQKHGIALNKAALIEALRNSDPEVRWLAAGKLLMHDKALETIPSIRDAVTREKDPAARINMSNFLALVGDEVGSATLQKDCADKSISMALRLRSVQYFLFQHKETCVDTVKEALSHDAGDIPTHLQALSLVPRFASLPDKDSDELIRLVVGDLRSKDAIIRLQASQALGLWGKSAAIPDLQGALANESDGPTRKQMEDDIASLSAIQSKASPK